MASPFAYRTHHFYGKAHAAGVIAAPRVITLVGTRGEEFVNQITFRAHHFDTVVAGLPGQLRAAGKIIDQLQDLIMAERVRSKAVNRRLQC